MGLVLGLGLWGVERIAQADQDAAKAGATSLATQAAVWIQQRVAVAIAPVLLLSAMVEFEPAYDSAAHLFEGMAPALRAQTPPNSLRRLLIAPSGVIRNVHPLEGNEKALGLDLLNATVSGVPQRFSGIVSAVAARCVSLNGPYGLLNGGVGIGINTPIFIRAAPDADFGSPDQVNPFCGDPCAYNSSAGLKFWGLAGAVIDVSALVSGADSPLTSLGDLGYRYELEAPQAPANMRRVAGSAVSPREPLVAAISLPNAQWVLRVSPQDGWEADWFGGAIAAVVVVAVALFALLFAVLVSRRKHKLLLQALLPRELYQDLASAKSVASLGTPIIKTDTPADLLLSMLYELLSGRIPDLRDVVLTRTVLLRHMDLYEPLDLRGQIREANLDADVMQALMRQLGAGPGSGPSEDGDFPPLDGCMVLAPLDGECDDATSCSSRALTHMFTAQQLGADTLSGALALLMAPGLPPPPPTASTVAAAVAAAAALAADGADSNFGPEAAVTGNIEYGKAGLPYVPQLSSHALAVNVSAVNAAVDPATVSPIGSRAGLPYSRISLREVASKSRLETAVLGSAPNSQSGAALPSRQQNSLLLNLGLLANATADGAATPGGPGNGAESPPPLAAGGGGGGGSRRFAPVASGRQSRVFGSTGAVAAALPAGPPPPLPPAILDEVERTLAAADGWQFDTWRLQEVTQGHALSCLGFYLMQREGLISTFKIKPVTLARLLRNIEAGYPANPYHNCTHAADVLQTLHVLVHGAGLHVHYLDRLGLLAAYFAAIVHDHGHPGLTNDFLIATCDPLAVRYNDRSPLENHHAASAFAMLLRPDLDAFAPLTTAEKAALRKQVIEMVMATDMKQHFGILAHFNTVHRLAAYNKDAGPELLAARASRDPGLDRPSPLAAGGPPRDSAKGGGGVLAAPKPLDETERVLTLQVAIKVADLGHLGEELPVHKRWLAVLEEEFFSQGDRERALGLPISPLFDRAKQGVSKSQVGFYDFVALPLVHAMSTAFPGARPLMACYASNYHHWRAVDGKPLPPAPASISGARGSVERPSPVKPAASGGGGGAFGGGGGAGGGGGGGGAGGGRGGGVAAAAAAGLRRTASSLGLKAAVSGAAPVVPSGEGASRHRRSSVSSVGFSSVTGMAGGTGGGGKAAAVAGAAPGSPPPAVTVTLAGGSAAESPVVPPAAEA
ncbi:hypothetical protein HYH03_009189 [Edaphochlamys debaryana]|uniref:Phosphodiesterase n=1 Tax=Edaphochlamys debaryana TaxID=47281 RepID=A0A835XZD5_9CHLO|nr:hypothetical protein HYH03_009189 [Edaphochlamys debaryana]|eukprot:KAG2492524.1 hypothetical protein HYH03_009189 [Edaphochlamys debaryana]